MMDLPKLPPDAIVRQHLDDWLDRNATRSARVVAGQPGSGKTVAVAAWARRRSNVRWITVACGATEAELRAALATFAEGELVVDGADRAAADGRAFLARLAPAAAAGVRIVYLVRDARMFEQADSAEPVAVLETAALRFDERELEGFCTAHGIAPTAKERQRFLAATDGWALAVAGTVRYAAAIGLGLGTAFPRWLATARPFLAQLVDEAGEAAFFVERGGDAYCVNPVVASLRGDGRGSARPAPAVIHMFGRFRVTIGNDEVCFDRRRARSLIQFLAMRSDGAATRDELMREFWPGMERRAAAGALVNTCSTIRRAIAQRVGREAVDEYFTVRRNAVALRSGNVVSTANRFSTHVKVASAAYDRGDVDAAVAHWSAALRLHSAPLLSGEPPAPWISAAQREFDEAARSGARVLAAVPPAAAAHAVRALTA
jgi:hypothetical protein